MCSEAGAKAKLLKLLQSSNDSKLSSEHSTAILEVVRAMAIDEVFRLAFRGSDGLLLVINILRSSGSQVGNSNDFIVMHKQYFVRKSDVVLCFS